jgi:Flp pilus assembly protein TadG
MRIFAFCGAAARRCVSIWRNRNGSAAIEFAFIAPSLFALVMGTVSYGGYFWMASSLQQLANDAARAAIAGLTDTERQSLAQSTFNSEITNYGMLSPSLASVNYQGSGESFAISVSYNAANMPFWVVSKFIPMPSTTIVRSAAVRLGGY